MKKGRAVLGLIAAALVFLSSFAHAFLGWRALGGRLTQTNAPADLILGFEVGWRWGGVVMIPFALILAWTFWPRFKGAPGPSTFPAAMIAVAYLAFGGWAAVHSGFDPFFLLFIVPGVLMAIAIS